MLSMGGIPAASSNSIGIWYFFATAFSPDTKASQSRTSDSDLAPFHSQELGLKLLWLARGQNTLDVGFVRYFRSNGLSADILSFGYGGRF